MKINITNGEEFNNYIKAVIDEKFIPFNEALIEGKPLFPLFDEKFIDERCTAHQVEKRIYLEKLTPFIDTIDSLKKEDELILWFGHDTFCQINLLGVLSYLEQKNIKNNIYLNIIDDISKEIIVKEMKISLGGFKESFISLFSENKIINTSLESINKGIKEYIHLFFEDNEIIEFIRNNKESLDRRTLVMEVFKRTRDYGLGDVQVIKLIKKVIE